MATTTTAGRGRGLTSPVRLPRIIRIRPAALKDKAAIDLLLRAGCLVQVVGK